MAKPLAPTFATVFGSVAEELKRRIGDAQAAQMGPPVADDITPAGDDERVRAWNARDPQATDQAMMELAQQKYAEHRQAGLPEDKAIKATAEDLTHFRYGQRLALYTYGQVGYNQQIKEAERIAKLAKRDTTPDPDPPPPTMPTAGLTNVQTLGATPEPPPAPAPPAGMGPDPSAPMSPALGIAPGPAQAPAGPPAPPPY